MKEEIKKAIARICLRSEDGDTWTLGTGFLVKENYILTALHVIAKKDPLPIIPFTKDFSVIFYKLENNQLIINYETTATLTNYYDHLSDWAILECSPIPENKNIKPISLISSKSFQLNQIDKKYWITYGFATGVKLEGMTYSGNITDPTGHDDNIAAIQLYCNEVGAANGILVNGLSGSPCIVDDIAVGILRSQLVKDDTYNQYFSKLVSLFFDKNKNQDKENEYKNILDFLSKKQQQISSSGGTLWACPMTNVVNNPKFSEKLYNSNLLAQIYIQPPGIGYDPNWYIYKKEIVKAENFLKSAGLPVVIQAPPKAGKSTFLTRLIKNLEDDNSIKSHILQIDIHKLNQQTNNIDSLLKQFAQLIVNQIIVNQTNNADFTWINTVWEKGGTSPDKLERLMETYILPNIEGRIVFVIDQIDTVGSWDNQANKNLFFGTLRHWATKHDKTPEKHAKNWRKLRLILVCISPDQLIVDPNQSPFNLTEPIKLTEFNCEEVKSLTKKYDLPFGEKEITSIMNIVGGHPFLTRLIMYKAKTEDLKLKDLLDFNDPNNNTFEPYLKIIFSYIKKNPDFKENLKHFKNGVSSSGLDSNICDQLMDLGILKKDGIRKYKLRCPFYELLIE